MTDMKFPLWSRAISAQGTVKESLGKVNAPLVCAGQIVNPGDVVVADDDGIVIVERNEVRAVTASSREREDKEATIRARLAKGEMTVDVLDMRARLAAKGLRLQSHADD